MRVKILLVLLLNFSFAFDVYELKDCVKTQASGEFNQTKNITGLNKPIKSSGEFSLKNGEFELRTLKPILNAVKITNEGIFTLNNNQWQKNEQMQDLRLILSLINLDIKAIKDEFSINLSGDKDSWQIELSPNGFFISKIFKSIKIYGDKYVKKIVLTEINGDETINEFSLK